MSEEILVHNEGFDAEFYKAKYDEKSEELEMLRKQMMAQQEINEKNRTERPETCENDEENTTNLPKATKKPSKGKIMKRDAKKDSSVNEIQEKNSKNMIDALSKKCSILEKKIRELVEGRNEFLVRSRIHKESLERGRKQFAKELENREFLISSLEKELSKRISREKELEVENSALATEGRQHKIQLNVQKKQIEKFQYVFDQAYANKLVQLELPDNKTPRKMFK